MKLMKNYFKISFMLLAFMGLAAESQAQTIYLSGTTSSGKSKVITSKGQTYNYNEPVITNLGANKNGVYALARTRNVPYYTKEKNMNILNSDYHHDYIPRWNQEITGGGVVYNNGSVYKAYGDPNWDNEYFYSSLVMKVKPSDVVVAGVLTKPYQYDKDHNNLLGFQSLMFGEVNKLSKFKSEWKHQDNAGKYKSKSFTDKLRTLRPMVWHITDCEYNGGKIYTVGAKEHDGSAYNVSDATRDYYYNHRVQIWANGNEFIKPNSGDYTNSWATSIDYIVPINMFLTSGFKWAPTQHVWDWADRKGIDSHKVTQYAQVWFGKNDAYDLGKRTDKTTKPWETAPRRELMIQKQVTNYVGSGFFFLMDDCLYMPPSKNGSKTSIIGGPNIKVWDICGTVQTDNKFVYALVTDENGEDKVYKVQFNSTKPILVHNFGKTGLRNKLIAVY